MHLYTDAEFDPEDFDEGDDDEDDGSVELDEEEAQDTNDYENEVSHLNEVLFFEREIIMKRLC
jgi:hypothetical protein